MAVIVSLLRGVNVGANNRMKMETLREVYESIGLANPVTYVQSGNVIFYTAQRNLTTLAGAIEDAIERKFGFRPAVILRTADELRDVIAANPFAGRPGLDPSKLLVTFLHRDPGEAARRQVRAIPIAPEELFIRGREMYIYYPQGAGRSKLPIAAIGKALQVQGTARNWNSVIKMLEIADGLRPSR